MSAIFLSYRRGDQDAARALYASLCLRRLNVFFDVDDIRPGELFPERLESALNACAVALLVIGPKWVSAEQLARLQQADDWVRREIEGLLARKSVKIIPVLLHETEFPNAQQLPESLQPILARHFLRVAHAQWSLQVAALVEEIGPHLKGGGMQPSAQEMPPLLPYLCDRVPQEDGAIDWLQGCADSANQRVCILPGHVMEGHDGVLHRLQHLRILDQLYEVEDRGVSFIQLEWNMEYAKQRQYDVLLRRAIKAILPRGKISKDDAIPAYFKTVEQPTVFVFKLGWRLAQSDGVELLRGLLSAWNQLFSIGDSAWIPKQPMILWINLTSDETNQEALPNDLQGVLKPLEPIGLEDISTWLGLDEVKPFTLAHQSDILQFPSRSEYCISTGKLHMLKFVDAIKQLYNMA